MTQTTTKFYNIRANLINNGRIYTETVAIKNIWEKNGSLFLDIYFHRLKKSFVFDSAFISYLYDINQDKGYDDIKKFAADFKSKPPTTSAKNDKLQLPKEEGGLLAPLKTDISMMMFVARCSHTPTVLKEKIIIDYICSQIKEAQSLSETYIKHFIHTLNCSEEAFYCGLTKLKSKKPQEAEHFLREVIKICLSDGNLHYTERTYIADIFQALRQEGLQFPADII